MQSKLSVLMPRKWGATGGDRNFTGGAAPLVTLGTAPDPVDRQTDRTTDHITPPHVPWRSNNLYRLVSSLSIRQHERTTVRVCASSLMIIVCCPASELLFLVA